jgi:hypothetical protein
MTLEFDQDAEAWFRGLTRVPARVFAGSWPASWGAPGAISARVV